MGLMACLWGSGLNGVFVGVWIGKMGEEEYTEKIFGLLLGWVGFGF